MNTLTSNTDDPEICKASVDPVPENPNLDGDRSNFYILIMLNALHSFPSSLACTVQLYLAIVWNVSKIFTVVFL